ncbi:MAG: hypothetical protein HYY02_12510 [Chloroflexi bacterium]|nr:hypothetical protein [Chloroflexota bacterium]
MTSYRQLATGRRRRGSLGRSASPEPELRIKEFLALLPELVGQQLPGPLGDFRVRGPVFSLVAFYYGEDLRIHYEVWVQRRTNRLEMGLHFEAEPEVNARWLAHYSRYATHILAALGPGVEGEQWTERWTRLHETQTLEPLSAAYAARVAARLVAFVRVLEPLRSVQGAPR